MNLNRSVTKSLLMAAAIGMVVPLHAAPAKKERDEAREGLPDRLPRKADAPPVVPGTLAKREDGRYVALAVENGHFALRFLDEEKVLQGLQAKRALVRWKQPAKSDELRGVLNENGTDALVGNIHVTPPYTFPVFVTLIGDDEKAIETIRVQLRD